MSATYQVVSRSVVLMPEARTPTRCQAKRCGRRVQPGEHINMVAHIRRSMAQPNAQNAHAYLCDRCTRRLGKRCLPEQPRRVLPPMEPVLVRGKPVEPW